jgi:hypothetical protein
MMQRTNLPASARALKDMIDVWNDVKARARQMFPDASEDELVVMTRSAIDAAVNEVLAK